MEPFCQTAKVCNMNYLPPFVVHGTHSMNEDGYKQNGELYGQVLHYLENREVELSEMSNYKYFNDYIATKMT